MAKPEIKIISISNVYCRLIHFKSAGDVEQGHCHSYDHGTLISSGRVLVEKFTDDGVTVKSSQEFAAPTFVYIEKNCVHKITALFDNTVACCIHALRDIDETILSPEFLIEQMQLSDTGENPTEEKPFISEVAKARGITLKPLAYPKNIEEVMGLQQNIMQFQSKGYVLIKNFLDPESVKVVSRYLENALRRYPENNQGDDPGDSSKISYYADPLIEMILADKLEHVEEITGFKLFPSYSFTRVYQRGEELKPHTDRPACEISLTCHIATVGKPWPVWMQAPGEEPTSYTLEPGDACVYKGCEIKHWRVPATETDINVQMMLHYVNQNGPNADHKFDRRPGLSLRK